MAEPGKTSNPEAAPSEGGSYVRNPVSGELTRLEAMATPVVTPSPAPAIAPVKPAQPNDAPTPAV